MMADEISQLKTQVAQRDEMINTMKIKMKDFVTKMKVDNEEALNKV
jgi:uncharacterized coiled-coil protein SlyX